MKVKPSVKPICEKCKVIRRKGRVMVICQNPVSYTHLTLPTTSRRQRQMCIRDRGSSA